MTAHAPTRATAATATVAIAAPLAAVARVTLAALVALCCVASQTRAAPDAPTGPPFVLALPQTPAPDATAALRAAILRNNIAAENGTAAARATLANASADPALRRAALAALADSANLTDEDAPALFALCAGNDPDTAVRALDALPALPASRRDIAACLRKALADAPPAVCAAAARAAARCDAGADVADALLALAQNTATAPAPRTAAAAALLALAARGTSTDATEGGLEKTAEKLFAADTALAPAIAAGLLRTGNDIPPALAEKFLTLPDELLAATLATYAAFPAKLDNDFPRRAALGEKPRAATTAAALLASRRSVKTNATLDCLAKILAAPNTPAAIAVLDNFSTDSEFARISGGGRSGGAATSSNDRFSGTAASVSIIGDLSDDFRHSRRGTGAHIPLSQWPDIGSILGLLGALDKITARGDLPAELRNKAYSVLLLESALPQMGDILHHLLANDNAAGQFIAWQIAARYLGEPRFLEIVLLNAAQKNTPPADVLFARLPPFLAHDEGPRSRLFSAAGRRLVATSDPLKQALGFIFLSAHGTPPDSRLALAPKHPGAPPPWHDPDARIRRAAAFALARLSPEVFAASAAAATAADPDPAVRAVLPLAFCRTGFRRECDIGGGAVFGQWAPALPDVALSEQNAALLRRMAQSDPDVNLRRLALHTLLQHGLLGDPAPLLAECPPENAALFTARVTQSVAAARASGKSVPPILEKFAPRLPDTAAPAALAIFLNAPKREVRLALESAVEGVREIVPGARIVFYSRDTAGEAILRGLCRWFPLTPEQKTKPVLVFGAGGWIASDTAPDFANLCELLAAAGNGDTARFAEILGLQFSKNPERVRDNRLVSEMLTGIAALEDTAKTEEEARRAREELLGTGWFWGLVGAAFACAILAIAGIFLWRWWSDLPTRRAENGTREEKEKHTK
ncbi:MAG: hypothetical protein LBT53_06730 [Puniceicoccales bacterium]|jgi:hypothetical protein|nr:hypothetical protein [Puniceicoccales bacterium]